MPFHFRKAEEPRRFPLNAEEQALARVLFLAIRNATDKIKIGELASIIERLDPDTLNRLLNAISLRQDIKSIEVSLLDSIEIGGNEAIRQIKKLGPALALPAFAPSPVKITNKVPMANMDFANIPAWASPNPPTASIGISFDKTNPNSLAFASKRAGQLVTSIDELTRIAIRKIIVDAFNEQIDVRATARRIKNVVGLHPRWADAVIKFEKREFQRLLRTGMKETTARTKSQERAVRYSDQLKSKRATMIARTEIQIAQNEGRYEGWKQADKAGLVDPQSSKMWVTAQDERTCPICAPLDGEMVPWNGVFSIGLEAPIVHPHCRCAMVIVPPERFL
jgi:SPP1 gp7 family putative phage head morphogenesis protein